MASQPTQNEGFRVVDEFVCDAIVEPSAVLVSPPGKIAKQAENEGIGLTPDVSPISLDEQSISAEHEIRGLTRKEVWGYVARSRRATARYRSDLARLKRVLRLHEQEIAALQSLRAGGRGSGRPAQSCLGITLLRRLGLRPAEAA